MFHKRITAKVTKVLKTKKIGAKKKKAKKEKSPEIPVPVQSDSELVPHVIPNAPVGPVGYDFKVGSRFRMSDTLYTVKAHYLDSNLTQIKVFSLENGEEVMSLDTLKREIKSDPTFKVLD